jgi:carbonic anhydrase/acetyltransferase-like protein (isoleucine patch superfamily)
MSHYTLGQTGPSLPPVFHWIAPSAAVIGNVIVGEDVGIWFGAVVRGDNEPITIGSATNIQENCVLHSDPGFPLTIGSGCTIGHGAIVHGCQIGDNTLIGMGAIVLNGANIGRNCMIGAGALVPQGAVIPEGSLVVGVPGRVVRLLEPSEIARQVKSAEHYVANAKRFASDLMME